MGNRLIHNGVPAVLASIGLTLGNITVSDAQARNFVLLNRYAVGGSVAEIISATPNGGLLAFTNAEDKTVGLVNIANPLRPEALATVDLSTLGEPTSVAITPNGRYAIAAVLADPEPGKLVFIDLATRQIVGQIQLTGVGPDSVAITPDGSKVVVAIEDEEDTDNLPGQRPGAINVVTINYENASESSVQAIAIDLSAVSGTNYVADPQPEFIAISPDGTAAAITLQENNAIALLDLSTNQITRIFSAGVSTHAQADLSEDGQVRLNQAFQGRREPDAIAFTPDGRYLVTANEGDTDRESFGDNVWSGGRGWTIFDLDGNVVYDDAGNLEALAAERGYYPDDRSENRGIEVEGGAVAQLSGKTIGFVAAERGNFVAAYNLANPQAPELLGFLPTGESPEGVLVIPGRNLLLTANEGNGTIDFYRFRP